jgi:hypothetical protein
MLVLRSKSGNIPSAWSSDTNPTVFDDSQSITASHTPESYCVSHARGLRLKLRNPVIFSVIAESRLCATGHYVRVSFRVRRGRGRRSICEMWTDLAYAAPANPQDSVANCARDAIIIPQSRISRIPARVSGTVQTKVCEGYDNLALA